MKTIKIIAILTIIIIINGCKKEDPTDFNKCNSIWVATTKANPGIENSFIIQEGGWKENANGTRSPIFNCSYGTVLSSLKSYRRGLASSEGRMECWRAYGKITWRSPSGNEEELNIQGIIAMPNCEVPFFNCRVEPSTGSGSFDGIYYDDIDDNIVGIHYPTVLKQSLSDEGNGQLGGPGGGYSPSSSKTDSLSIGAVSTGRLSMIVHTSDPKIFQIYDRVIGTSEYISTNRHLKRMSGY